MLAGQEGLYVMSTPVTEPVVVNGRTLVAGMELSFTGKRGRFTYLDASITSAGRVVLNVNGGPSGRRMLHSFYADNIRTVHRSQGRR